MMPQESMAQFSPGKKTKDARAVEYRKVSSDSVRPRNGKTVKKSGGKSSVKSSKKKTKKKEKRIDSLRYEPAKHRLGDRVIMPGDSGHDVKSVADILVKKLYMDETLIIYTEDGGVKYEGELVRALKYFQDFNGFYPDGIIGHSVIKALRRRK